MNSPNNIENSIKQLTVASSDTVHARILDKLLTRLGTSKKQGAAQQMHTRRIVLWRRVSYLTVALLVVSSWACFVLSKKISALKEELEQAHQSTALAPAEDSATINFYLKEHEDAIARRASFSPATREPTQMQLSRHDILYYESLDRELEIMRPGIIIRGPLSEREADSPESPTIANGHTLTLSEARQVADFQLVAPSWLHPGFTLDQIRRIEDHDTLQLLYTNGIDSISLFEQPLDGRRKLEPQDFREYAVYRNREQPGGTILAWSDGALSYVLIGNGELSQLMDMARSIGTER